MRRATSRLRYNGILVLSALAQGHRYGFSIIEETGLPSGTVYPLLRRFEAAGLVSSAWERDMSPREAGRPRRRYYEIEESGRQALAEAGERLRAHQPLVAALLRSESGGGEE